MGPNATIYCLEKLTDYAEFERLCDDLMALEGYPSIEPLGGSKDRGRDAIHVSRTDETTIFAYSVREDWRAKLAEDASKIRRHDHRCDRLVFITTKRFTPGERDEAKTHIRDEYGWELELVGLERLRILLDVTHPQVKPLHSQIFPPEFLNWQTGVSSSHDHLLISAAPEDDALADWLTRKLTAEGYLVWCDRSWLLGEEACPGDIDDLITNEAFGVIGLYSRASLQNPEVTRQRTLALAQRSRRGNDFLIPVNVDDPPPTSLDRVTATLDFVSFNNWAVGLRVLLKRLEARGCPKPFVGGKTAMAAAFFEQDVLSDQVELLYSNCLQIIQMPDFVHVYEAPETISSASLRAVRPEWAYRKITPRVFVSFHQPPPQFADKHRLETIENIHWRQHKKIRRVLTRHLISELLRKSFTVRCHTAGLRYCTATRLQHFVPGLVGGERLIYTRPDGTRTFVFAVGQRKFWRPHDRSEIYHYALAPDFSIVQDLFDDFVVLLRIGIWLSDDSGRPLPRRTAISRRKHLCRDWYNDHWLARTLAICEYLAEDGRIVIGDQPEEQIIVDATPVRVSAPLGINEDCLGQVLYDRTALKPKGLPTESNDDEEG